MEGILKSNGGGGVGGVHMGSSKEHCAKPLCTAHSGKDIEVGGNERGMEITHENPGLSRKPEAMSKKCLGGGRPPGA